LPFIYGPISLPP
jgi:hypothetical protein